MVTLTRPRGSSTEWQSRVEPYLQRSVSTACGPLGSLSAIPPRVVDRGRTEVRSDMDWIPLYRSLAAHPKTRRLARKLKSPVPLVVGHLSLLWSWAVEWSPDGDLGQYGPEDIADACMWDGDSEQFFAALVECNFIDPGPRLHDWLDHTGGHLVRYAAKREQAAAAGKASGEARRNGRSTSVQRPSNEPRTDHEQDVDVDVDVENLEPNPLARDELGRVGVEAPDEGKAGGQQARGLTGAASEAVSPRPPAASTREPAGFAEFYEVYPRKVGRRRAASAYRSALRRVPADVIAAAVSRYAADPNQPLDRTKIPHPTTWLNRDGWDDEPLPPRTEGGTVDYLDRWAASRG